MGTKNAVPRHSWDFTLQVMGALECLKRNWHSLIKVIKSCEVLM